MVKCTLGESRGFFLVLRATRMGISMHIHCKTLLKVSMSNKPSDIDLCYEFVNKLIGLDLIVAWILLIPNGSGITAVIVIASKSPT